MRKFRFVGGRIAAFAIVGVTAAGLLVSMLWNAVIPAVFGLPAIGFWQALALFALSRIFFGHFGGRPFSKARFARGWGNLTPEERVRFRAAMGHHCPPGMNQDRDAAPQG